MEDVKVGKYRWSGLSSVDANLAPYGVCFLSLSTGLILLSPQMLSAFSRDILGFMIFIAYFQILSHLLDCSSMAAYDI